MIETLTKLIARNEDSRMGGFMECWSEVFDEILADVPKYDSFLTVDELDQNSANLAAENPNKVRLVEIGRSREGHAIAALKIGRGRNNALLFGFPHPDEPIGSMTLEYFSRKLVENPDLEKLDYTWYIVKCIDPDGARLNEGWFKGPFTPLHFMLHHYRPATHHQIEWTFPVDYKTLHFRRPLPETKALMNIIDSTKPRFMYSLHNSGFGGTYFYVTSRCPPLYPIFHRLVSREKLPLHLGEPEMPFMNQYARAIFELFPVSQIYDFLKEETGGDPAKIWRAGGSSDEYASNAAGTFTIVCEMPYWYDPRIKDTSKSDISRKDCILQAAKTTEERIRYIRMKFKEAKANIRPTPEKGLFAASIDCQIRELLQFAQADKHRAMNDSRLRCKATIAEEFDSRVIRQLYNLIWLAMLHRYVKGTSQRRIEKELKSTLLRWYGDIERSLSYRVIPIRSLVRVQLGSALAAASFVQGRTVRLRSI